MKKFLKLLLIFTFAITNVFAFSANTNQVDAKLSVHNIRTCDMNPNRKANYTVDVGVGRRVYLAHTNSSKQLVWIHANKITLQNKHEHLVHNRYCNSQAKVSGTSSRNYDRGHGIADSLGGASNAYNISAQNSFVNRHGAQYKLEAKIRQALQHHKSVTNFVYNIKYANSRTQIPSSYYGSYKINGKLQHFNFKNSTQNATKPAPRQTTTNNNTYDHPHWGANHHCYAYHHRGMIPNSYCK